MMQPGELDIQTRAAAGVLLVTSLLHIFAFAIYNWNPDTIRLIPFGVVYAALGIALLRGWAKGRIVALVCAGFGMIAAIVTMRTADVPIWLTQVLIGLDVVVVTCLTWSLWRRRAD